MIFLRKLILIISIFLYCKSLFAIEPDLIESDSEISNQVLEENREIKELKINYRANKDGFVENFKDWNLYKTKVGNADVCYVLSIPIENTESIIDRGESYYVVTRIADDADEITASSGFMYRKNSDAEISFGSRKFYLFTFRAIAWAYNKNDDIEIIKEMQKSDDFIITSYTRSGKIIGDRYSLIGFNKAYVKLKEICK